MTQRNADNTDWDNLYPVTKSSNVNMASGDNAEGAIQKIISGITKVNSAANSDAATKLQTARAISLTGDISGSVSFDGSANASINTTLASSGVPAGNYKSVTVDAKGRVTGGSNPSTLSGYGITDALPASSYTANDVLAKLKTVDGSNSGLDADTLDGYHSSSFATAAQGAKADNALPASNYNANDILTKIKTVDGASSGLDADTLDGYHSSSFATAAQGAKADSALPASSYTANDVLAKLKTVAGSRSGLDADTLDGYDSSYYTPIADFNCYFTPTDHSSGYQKLPSGVIIQWMSISACNSSGTVNWPITFPNSCRWAMAGLDRSSGYPATSGVVNGWNAFTVSYQAWEGSSLASCGWMMIIGIGS